MNNIAFYYTSNKALSDALYCDSSDNIAHLLSYCSMVASVKVKKEWPQERVTLLKAPWSMWSEILFVC